MLSLTFSHDSNDCEGLLLVERGCDWCRGVRLTISVVEESGVDWSGLENCVVVPKETHL